MTSIVRFPVAWERLGIKRSKFYDGFIKTGRIRPVKIGPKCRGVFEDELDAVVEELRRERDAETGAAK
jgi:predicted DNA-binding transcriptional regulator AlpA